MPSRFTLEAAPVNGTGNCIGRPAPFCFMKLFNVAAASPSSPAQYATS